MFTMSYLFNVAFSRLESHLNVPSLIVMAASGDDLVLDEREMDFLIIPPYQYDWS